MKDTNRISLLLFVLICSGCATESSESVGIPTESMKTQLEPIKPKEAQSQKKKLTTEAKVSKVPVLKISDIDVISVKVSQVVPENYVKAIGGTWLYLKWKNKSKVPVREIWGRVTVFNSAGEKMRLWDNYELPLYAESTAVLPGKVFVTTDSINGYPQVDQEEPVRATVTITRALTELSDL